ncbi:phosphoglycolate phosphatase [Lachnospiraceae bacterium YSD2013]|nr:phosphoglycolate phosphatase [Lachnospiraceae bacterium YSD2013]
MYKYVLFDLDGTISDPKVGICTSVQQALKKFGIDVPDINTLTPFIGPPLRDSFRDFYHIKPEDMEDVIAAYRARFSTVGLFENDLYDGIPELLKSLKENDRKLALASSKPRVFVEKILDHFGISQYFDVIMGSELDGTRENKSEIIAECLRLFELDPSGDLSETVMVGDRKYDIEAANAAGLPNIAVSYGYGSEEELSKAGAMVIAGTVKELENILLN